MAYSAICADKLTCHLYLYLPVYLPVFAVEAVVPHTKNRTLFTDLKFSKGGVCFFLW